MIRKGNEYKIEYQFSPSTLLKRGGGEGKQGMDLGGTSKWVSRKKLRPCKLERTLEETR
jgi:hypothetical protein